MPQSKRWLNLGLAVTCTNIIIILVALLPGAEAVDIIRFDSSVYTQSKTGTTGQGYVNGGFASAKFWQPQGGIMIKGTNIMLMADTENQVIRKIDWGAQTVAAVVGNATVQGNCLDGSCPANSFKDGSNTAVTFTMPYSITLHDKQKYALIADTRSNAIRKLNLYDSSVLTVLRDRGFPTDIVSFGDSVIYCDGQNHSIWKYTNANQGLMDQTTGSWSTTSLTLLSGANSPLAGQYADGSSANSRFWEPLGITYNTVDGFLYVADYRNRVIRQVNVATGETFTAVGQQALPPDIVDSAVSGTSSVLCGPTNVQWHAATNSIYFTDRNPTTNMGALRVWNMGTGSVKTIVGQDTRKSASVNGLATSSTVGVGGIWGLAVPESGGWVGWSEADTHTLRIASPSSQTQADAMPCATGQYYSTAGSACTPCTNTIPYLTTYVTSGAPNINSCPWTCPDPPMYRPFACPNYAAAVSNAMLGTSTDATAQTIVCNAGFQKIGGMACQACSSNFYCTGLNTADTGREACIANSGSLSSSTTSSDCKCNPAYYGADGVSCSLCPVSTYCLGDTDNPTQCIANSNSSAGSFSATACVCNAGYYGPNGGALCTGCSPNFYCQATTSTACPSQSSSPAYSSVVTACVCNAGFYGANGATCNTCSVNNYCVGGNSQQGCPANSHSASQSPALSSCLCNAGYYGDAGGPCTLCPAGSYCPGEQAPPVACQANSYSVPGSITVDKCVCDNGYQDSSDVNVCNPCTSSACANGLYRSDCEAYTSLTDVDSVCTFSCSTPSSNTSAYTWTSGGSYNSTYTFAGKDDCTFTCNTLYYRQINPSKPPDDLCASCTSNAAVCFVGSYLDLAGCSASSYTDSQCVACSNKPSFSTYTGYGSVNTNNCAWECNVGYYSEGGVCLPCSSSPGEPTSPGFVPPPGESMRRASGTVSSCAYGIYRSQCTRGTDLVAGTDSLCTETCTTANAATPASFSWTGLSTYDSVLYKGNNDCTLTCSFNTGTGYYFSNSPEANPHLQVCTKITERNATCGTGTYTGAATATADTYCTACTNYPLNTAGALLGPSNMYDGIDLNVNMDTTFLWYSTGSYNDPYGLLGSTCEFLCYSGIQSIAGYHLDDSKAITVGALSGYPTAGTCSECSMANCSVGSYRGVCQAHSHTDSGTCETCVNQRIENSVAVGWHTLFPGQDTCNFACITNYYHSTNTTCSPCQTDAGPSPGAGCANGYFINRKQDCTNNSNSDLCEPCSPGTFANGNWMDVGQVDDTSCVNVSSACDANYYANPPATTGALACAGCNQNYQACAAGTWLPLCGVGSLANAACTTCALTPAPPNSASTNGLVLGQDSCSYLCNAPGYYDISNRACAACDTDYAACGVGTYLDACVHNNNTREVAARQAVCKTCTNLPPAYATFSTRGQSFNSSDTCEWTCATGYHRVGTYAAGSCQPCFQGPCSTGQYLAQCGSGDGQADNVCVGCTNKDAAAGGAHSEYISNGTVSNLVGNNDCKWRCSVNYYGASVGTGVTTQSAGGECSACNMEACGAGTYRGTCGAGSNSDAVCTACTTAPLFSTLGLATPYNTDNCLVGCWAGWYGLPGQRFCCSDNSYINSPGQCTCSAGFRVGGSMVDGADCNP